MTKILYVGLDDRPCNYHYPLMLSDICDDIDMIAPPFELMGKLKKAADTDAIWKWLFENVSDADYAILSVDTLVYGNIIHSRIHNRSKEQCDAYMENFRKLKELNPKLEIHAFNLVARVAAYDNDFEDPTYWANYGYAIWRYGWLKDRINRGQDLEGEKEEFEKLSTSIPQEYLKDFLDRRAISRHINHKSVDFTKEGIFERLVVPKDDTAEYGYAATDQAALSKKIYEERIMDKVMVYPGADEVGSVLFARIFNKVKNFTPRIYTRYSSTLGPTIVPRYEDRPLNESIKAQITSLGGVIVDTPMESDMLFAINSPGKFQMESDKQFTNKDLTFSSHINLHEFASFINYYIKAYNKPVALADVTMSNGSDDEMMSYMSNIKLLDKLCAYGGWNTAENTNGMCLAHAVIHAYYETVGFEGGNRLKSEEFCAMKIIEDWLFQANALHMGEREVVKRYPGKSPYFVADIHDEIANYMGEEVINLIDKEFAGIFKGKNVEISNFRMPWDRVHELHFDIKLV